MKSLVEINKRFLERAMPVSVPSSVPIIPVVNNQDTAVIAVEKWHAKNDPKRLCKTFRFRLFEQKRAFVVSLLNYEAEVSHSAAIKINVDDSVSIEVWTKDVEVISELDKEYAKYCDVLYKDIVYSCAYGSENNQAACTSF